jgi:DNA-binding NtrC family response regulator
MAETLKRVLVVGSTGFAVLERRRLEREGHHVETARTSDEAFAALTRACPDLIVTQYELPEGMSGLELEDKLAARGHRVPLVMVTGTQDVTVMLAAHRAGKRDFPMRSTPHISGLPELVSRTLMLG